MPQPQWIRGDGGPTVLLQAGAVPYWQGAADFPNSLMGGGTVETDYDVICACPDGVTRLHRHGRDMLVLSDSEWPAAFVPCAGAECAILQSFGSDSPPEVLAGRLAQTAPQEVLRLVVQDQRLRLLVGADDGQGGSYGQAEALVTPGEKECRVHLAGEGLLVIIG